MLVSLYLLLVIAECISDEYSELKVILFLIIIFCDGFMTNMLGLNNNRYTFCWSSQEISSMATGGAMVGVTCSLMSLFFSFIPVSPTVQFIIYLVFSTMVYIAIMLCFLSYLKRYVGDKKYTGNELSEREIPYGDRPTGSNGYFSDQIGDKRNQDSNALSSQGDFKETVIPQKALALENQTSMKIQEVTGDPMVEYNKTQLKVRIRNIFVRIKRRETWAARWLAFKQTYTAVLILFWNCSTALGVFPALMFIVGIGLRPEHQFPLITLLYHCGDLAGKYTYKHIQMRDGKPYYILAT